MLLITIVLLTAHAWEHLNLFLCSKSHVLILSVQNLLPATQFISEGNAVGSIPTEVPAKQVKLPAHSIPLLFKSQKLPLKVIKLNELDYKHDIIPHWISDELQTKPLAQ